MKKSFFLLVVALLLVTNLGAQSVKADEPPDLPHPRLYFTSEDIVQLRALRDAPSHQAIWNNIKSWADAHINDSPPAQTNNWNIAQDIRDYVETMSFMYAMTGNSTYAHAAKSWMLFVSDNWSKWGDNEAYNAPVPYLTIGFACGYDALYDYFTPEERNTIRNAIVDHVAPSYNYIKDYPEVSQGYVDSVAWRPAVIGLAGLALDVDYEYSEDWVSLAVTQAQRALSIYETYGPYGGVGYTEVGLQGLIPFLDALKRIEGQDLFDGNNFLQELSRYFLYCNYNGKPLQFEDCNWYEGYLFDNEGMASFLYKLASEYNDGYAQWFADQCAGKSVMQTFIWKDPSIVATPPTDLPLTKHFENLGYVIFRTGWGANDLVFAFKSGTSQGHAHPSQNEFGIYYKGIPITCGPGYVCAYITDDTWPHNCILVDGEGQGQEPGDYSSLPLGTRGEIKQVDISDPYYRYVLGDASAPYDGRLNKWLRHVVFMEPNYFVIYDEVAASLPKQFDLVLNLPLHNWHGEVPSVSVEEDLITLTNRNDGLSAQLSAMVVEPDAFTHEIISYNQNPYDYGTANQIRVQTSAPATAAEFLTALFPDEVLPVDEVKIENLLGVIITNGDNKDLILFSKDGNPVDEYIELGGIYKAIDGGDYLFEGTGVRVQFNSYQVLRLQESVDATPPVISSIAASDITGASATISWSTDEPATSQVEYGTTEDLGLSTDLDTSLVTNHSVSLTDLANATTYHYKVKSKDAAGNSATSKVYNFTTLSPYLSISFTSPTDADNSVVNRNWTEINTSIDSTFDVSSFIDWNKSLVGYCNLNENSGSQALDKSTYGNNGRLIGGSQWEAGKFGNALKLLSDSDYLLIADSESMDFDKSEGTIAMWLYPFDKASGAYQRLVIDSNWDFGNSPGGIELAIQSSGNLYFYPAKGGSNNYNLVTDPLNNNEWQHLTVTWDYSTKKVLIYINGVSKSFAEENVPANWDAIAQTGNWHIGGTNLDVAGKYFNGLIDEVRIWNRALSEEEIKASYNTNLHSLSHKFTDLADGSYEYYAYATDLSGNSAQTETRTLIIDTIPPAISNATLEGHVTFTERGSNNSKWAESFSVTLFEAGNLSNVLWTDNATTNNIGVFTVSGLTPGTYDIGVKNRTSLSELVTNEILTAGNTTVVNFGTTREGDANNDDHITILDASSLASSHGSSEGDPGWNPHCDFNRDGNINILDTSALASNYGQHGDLA